MVKLEPIENQLSDNPARPSVGTVGKRITVETNIYPIRAIADTKAFQYDITLHPDVPPTVSRLLWKSVEAKVRSIKPQLSGALLAYDGRKNCFSTADLCEMGQSVSVTVEFDRSSQGKNPFF